ncbi:DUF3892 domain-containing protein [Chryseobacterium soli]|uniref:DUF3892 domain-containing protein n=1 Tax=Chryseobacterium soli TaxID=445961 RepID=A0A086A0J2_9FLAO|nr:DUF3892 domain-containing protein [Chryseobacterium soli]KFF10206.1 hypothetical protein IW15_20755 [Chryseobacterium soli]MDV7697500.1 DUF3892 domain-containing protein [Chryseobacterium soli]
MAITITCINKDSGNHENPNLAITHLGWISTEGKLVKNTRLEIYNWIKDENGIAYVTDSNNKVKVITAETSNGTKYLKTEADSSTKNNLLSLPECK